ncbi:MAG: 4'-phosphopantetheinyl transferase superfamily protein [Christiangramia sp.]|nr:4'-phosphopantetheinyl transferase superfamily protein [Christiangramia sp.]
MIGNDIIDLKIALAENKSANSRYLAKSFTEREISEIKNDIDPELKLWTFWAMKETAYKNHQRTYGLPRKLNPLGFECHLNDSGKKGIVKIDDQQYSVIVDISSDHINCYSVETRTFQKSYLCDADPKAAFLKDISSEFNLDASELSISKDEFGMPSLKIGTALKKVPLSISHHGDFSALMIPLINS